MLELTRDVLDRLVALAYDRYPEEACGLLAGPPREDRAVEFYVCRNAAASARVYTIDPGDHLRAERDADAHDWEINGVVHSHTHSEPYPSPTDVAQAPDPAWHYVIVSLKRHVPEIRSYRVVDGVIDEEPVSVG